MENKQILLCSQSRQIQASEALAICPNRGMIDYVLKTVGLSQTVRSDLFNHHGHRMMKSFTFESLCTLLHILQLLLLDTLEREILLWWQLYSASDE